MKWVRGQAGDKMDPVLFSLDLEGTVTRSDRSEAGRGLRTLKGSLAGARHEEPDGERRRVHEQSDVWASRGRWC